MKVALIDIDMLKCKRRRAFPNLALMKLSAWHKSRGDDVSLNFPLAGIDLVYASCVFTWHKPKDISAEVQYGGSGIGNYESVLPKEVEHIMPDYGLYPDVHWSMGYTSRGCIRNCRFCKVRAKEGYIEAVAEPTEFHYPRFHEILLLDNNILAAPNCISTLKWLANARLLTDFNQGLDIRCLDDEKVHYLTQIRIRTYRFAFDDISYEKDVKAGIALMDRAGVSRRKLSFYVLVGFRGNDHAIERVKMLQAYGVDIYPMIYKDDDGKEPNVSYKFTETIRFHGARGNLRKFLRVTGRLACIFP